MNFSWGFAKEMLLILLIYLVMVGFPLVAVMIYEIKRRRK